MADKNQPTRNGGSASGGAIRINRNAFDPKAPALVQPYARLVGEGHITEISVTFTPTGITVKGKAGESLVSVDNSGLNNSDYYPLAKLASIAERGNIAPAPGNKKKGNAGSPAVLLPTKSLCKEDLGGGKTIATLQQRANAVAAACGGGPLVGRVRSGGRFKGTETVSYQDWWESASGSDRALSLCQGKNFSSLDKAELAKFSGLECPFRGTLEFAVSEDADQDD